jgi:serine phosphatase RsbU (regulator of sigma subunit)
MDDLALGEVLRALRDFSPEGLTAHLHRLARHAGAEDAVAYLVDFEQMTLMPIHDRRQHRATPVSEPVEGTAMGSAFREQRVVSEAVDGGVCLWAPVFEGSDCTGVIGLTVAGTPEPGMAREAEELGMLVGAAIAIAARYTDLYSSIRRRKEMSLPASMQWDQLPPLRLSTATATSTGILEPAYDVGGDSFDHAANGVHLDVAIMDAMGHGLTASIISSLAMGSYRHDRREGQPLSVMHQNLNDVVAGQFGGSVFVTGQIARLDLRTGGLIWINAGHPKPLLVRGHRVVDSLSCPPSLPWGLGGALEGEKVETLEPGDSVVFYTDGVTEGRSGGGELFGIDRFVDLIEQAAATRASSSAILRTLIQDVLAHQNHRLRDDATVVWLSWDPST